MTGEESIKHRINHLTPIDRDPAYDPDRGWMLVGAAMIAASALVMLGAIVAIWKAAHS